jgi:hypothetical protein
LLISVYIPTAWVKVYFVAGRAGAANEIARRRGESNGGHSRQGQSAEEEQAETEEQCGNRESAAHTYTSDKEFLFQHIRSREKQARVLAFLSLLALAIALAYTMWSLQDKIVSTILRFFNSAEKFNFYQ